MAKARLPAGAMKNKAQDTNAMEKIKTTLHRTLRKILTLLSMASLME
jgi:hypothetical protein